MWACSLSYDQLQSFLTNLFSGVQRGSYGYDGHEDDGDSVVVVLICTPEDHTEELEDVERVEDLEDGEAGK